MNFERPLTYLITKGESTPSNFEQSRSEIVDIVRAAGRTGISIVQIREKSIPAKHLFQLVRECKDSLYGSETILVVNGRPDIAKAVGTDGVHLPESSLPVNAVRQEFPRPFLVGASVHSVETASEAKKAGADYVMFGPVFDTPGKTAKGIDELTNVCDMLEGFPVIAVGGIDGTNYTQVLEAGAAGYAAIRYLNEIVRTN